MVRFDGVREAWEKWGNLVATAVGVLATLAAAGYFIGGLKSDLGRLQQDNAAHATATKEIAASLQELRRSDLTAVNGKISKLEADLGLLALGPGGVASDQKLSILTSHLAELRERHGEVDSQLSSIEAHLSRLSAIESRQEKILGEHNEIRREGSDRFIEMLAELGELKGELKRLDAILELLRPFVTEGLALGRIDSEDLRVLYSPSEIERFISASKRLILETPEHGPEENRGSSRPGSRGGGGSVRTASGTLDFSSLICVGPPTNCTEIGVFLDERVPGHSRPARRIEVFYGLSEAEYAALTSYGDEVRLAEAMTHSGKLCEWIGIELSKLYSAGGQTPPSSGPA